jgi:LAO/AO transport system kinase
MPSKKEEDKIKIQKGVPSPGSINPRLRLNRRTLPSTRTLVEGILSGDRVRLGQAITYIESHNARHQQIAQEVVEHCLAHAGKSIRIGITGSPGVGKSSFIESFGQHLLQQGRRIAVLAIDPSSQLSKGSILGDKTRMEVLSTKADVFIRPSPAGESLGGVAQKTREAIVLCEAAAYDTIIIETVGVGQSEIAVHSMVDFFLLLLLPGGGDELQGIKRGIVEMADLLAVNKADGDRLPLAKQTKRAYKNALHLFPPKKSGWTPRVEICSAVNGFGIPAIWQYIIEYESMAQQNGFFGQNRSAQAKYWLEEAIKQKLQHAFFASENVRNKLQPVTDAVVQGKKTALKAATELITAFMDHIKQE